jgi:hypothetical protein
MAKILNVNTKQGSPPEHFYSTKTDKSGDLHEQKAQELGEEEEGDKDYMTMLITPQRY